MQEISNPNRQTENNAAALQAGYAFADTPISVGATYFGSYAFGLNGLNPQYNPHVDNTLPGFSESTMLEAFAGTFKIATGVSLGVSRFVRWEGRDQSIFDQSTLLTSHPAENPAYPIPNTPGSLVFDADYVPNAYFSASLEQFSSASVVESKNAARTRLLYKL